MEPLPEGSIVVVNMSFKMKCEVVGAILDRVIVRKIMGRKLALSLAGLKYNVETGTAVADITGGLGWPADCRGRTDQHTVRGTDPPNQ